MGGGRRLLGRETLGPWGGCSGEGPLCQWPPLGSPQAPSLRASLPLEPPRCPLRSRSLPRSACLCSRNSAPGSCCRPWAPLWSGLPPPSRQPSPSHAHLDAVLRSSCTKLSSCYTPDRPLIATAANPPPPHQTSRRLHHAAHRPALPLPSPSIASHRQTAASSDLYSPRRYLGWTQPLDNDPDSWLPLKGPVTFSETHFLPNPRDLLCSCHMAARVQLCLAAKSSLSFSLVDQLVLPRIHFPSEFAAFSQVLFDQQNNLYLLLNSFILPGEKYFPYFQ
uniref:Retrotransposon Gag like 8B n=1 Tax=Pongo abelii TaxID=9601 RepID=A0A8I5TJ93_PONAB